MSMLTNFGGKKKKNHIKKENCSIPLRPPPCHKIWMSRKVICVCWEMKCSTGLKTYCICLEICFPGRMSGVSEREAAACVSSKREGRHSHHQLVYNVLLYLLQSAQPGSTLTPDRCSQHEVQSTERGNESEQERGRRMEIFSRVHNKSLIMNNTNGSLFSSYGSPGLWEIVFGFHMGAAVCQK